ncbi:MAG: sigma factor-binding protein Crl [Psychromonas sp.]
MTLDSTKTPSRGRLFKLFTDLGPYFRKLQSTESSYFFDCLEICIDMEKEPEEREFYGWWLIVENNDAGYTFKRFDGRFNLAAEWEVEKLTEEQQQQIDKSFDLFIVRLQALIKESTMHELHEQQVVLS